MLPTVLISATIGRSPAHERTEAMREWGAANGFKVNGRGGVSTELQNAHHAAN